MNAGLRTPRSLTATRPGGIPELAVEFPYPPVSFLAGVLQLDHRSPCHGRAIGPNPVPVVF